MRNHDAATRVFTQPASGWPVIRNVELQELIGKGQTADVYLGLHGRLRRAVAVKILHDHLSDSQEVVDRFRQEASVIADLHHPSIIQIHDMDEVDGRCYIVMEYLSGPTLAAYMGQRTRKSQIPVRDVIRIVSQVADALGFAHLSGILHRDVKPANIVLRSPTKVVLPGGALPQDATPVLTDFGLARLTHGPRTTRDGITLGTPAYMSPEQVMGGPLDGRSDLYSLGVIFYEMLTGDLPLVRDSDSLTGLMYRQVHQEFPRLPHTLRRMQSIVDRLLAKEREQRFASAADLIDALHKFQEAYLGGNGTKPIHARSLLDIEALRKRLIRASGLRMPVPSGAADEPMGTFVNVRSLRDVLFGRAAPRSAPIPQPRAWATNLNLSYLRGRLLGSSSGTEKLTGRRRRWVAPAILAALLGCGAMAGRRAEGRGHGSTWSVMSHQRVRLRPGPLRRGPPSPQPPSAPPLPARRRPFLPRRHRVPSPRPNLHPSLRPSPHPSPRPSRRPRRLQLPFRPIHRSCRHSRPWRHSRPCLLSCPHFRSDRPPALS